MTELLPLKEPPALKEEIDVRPIILIFGLFLIFSLLKKQKYEV